MDISEMIVFILAGFLSFVFLYKWYRYVFNAWPTERSIVIRYTLGWLPAVSLAIIMYTLRYLASFDVVESFIYILFYIAIGYAWLYLGMMIMIVFFDISWIDDAINLNNKAALIAIAGGYIGMTLIYSGSNIGDGPGWWCVIFAGGLGTVAWTALGVIVSLGANISERITIERDYNCGIRFGSYLVAAGIILGRASAGDWTSFTMTVIEFMVGWPVLILTVLALSIERYYLDKSQSGREIYEGSLISSVIWGIIYITSAILCVVLFPL